MSKFGKQVIKLLKERPREWEFGLQDLNGYKAAEAKHQKTGIHINTDSKVHCVAAMYAPVSWREQRKIRKLVRKIRDKNAALALEDKRDATEEVNTYGGVPKRRRGWKIAMRDTTRIVVIMCFGGLGGLMAMTVAAMLWPENIGVTSFDFVVILSWALAAVVISTLLSAWLASAITRDRKILGGE